MCFLEFDKSSYSFKWGNNIPTIENSFLWHSRRTSFRCLMRNNLIYYRFTFTITFELILRRNWVILFSRSQACLVLFYNSDPFIPIGFTSSSNVSIPLSFSIIPSFDSVISNSVISSDSSIKAKYTHKHYYLHMLEAKRIYNPGHFRIRGE